MQWQCTVEVQNLQMKKKRICLSHWLPQRVLHMHWLIKKTWPPLIAYEISVFGWRGAETEGDKGQFPYLRAAPCCFFSAGTSLPSFLLIPSLCWLTAIALSLVSAQNENYNPPRSPPRRSFFFEISGSVHTRKEYLWPSVYA